MSLPPRLNATLIDGQLPTPLYHQVYLVLRDTIGSGEIPPGSLLPGEFELADTFKVSRITVKRALNELVNDAYVTRHRGRGTIVSPRAHLPIVRGSFETLIDSLKLMGDRTQLRLLESGDIVPDPAVANHLALDAHEKVQRAVRLRLVENQPFSYLVSFVPLAIARTYTRVELATTPLLKLLERGGSRIDQADQWITAVAADPTIALALGVVGGSPLLKIERVMRDAAGRPVELIHAHYRPDRFVYFVQQKGLAGKPAARKRAPPKGRGTVPRSTRKNPK